MRYSLAPLAALLVLLSLNLHAQQSCGTDQVHEAVMKRDEAYRNTIMRNEEILRKQIQEGILPRSGSLDDSGIYYIPVVVHIVHTGEAVGTSRNPTDAKVQAIIDHTNKIFAAGSGFSNSVPFPVKFVLAKRSPDCQATNGILRVNGSSVAGYSDKGVTISGTAGYADETSIKNLSRWPNTDYYNIWVVHNIEKYEGFAYYPGAPASIDGTVIRVSSVNNLNTTLAHELGHGFNLRHTFEGDNNGSACPDTASSCQNSGDFVCDTEPHKRPSGCPSDPNPCTGRSFFNTQYNIMNYSSCKNRFTAGQRERFIAAFSLRASLANSTAWMPTGPQVAQACRPVCLDSSTYTGVGITRVSLNRLQYASSYTSFEGPYLDKSCTQGDTLLRNVSYNLQVTTQSRIQNVRAFADFNNNGQFENNEKVFSSNGTTAYQVHHGMFTVPANAVLNTPIRFRIVTDANTNAEPQACGPLEFGQAEDYALYLKEPLAQQGIITGVADTICYAGNPSPANFLVLPGGTTVHYQWYYKTGIVIAPTGKQNTGWTEVIGANSASYTPPSGLIASRTYACQVSVDGADAIWAAGVHYTVTLAQASRGGLSGNWTILTGTSPGAINLYPAPAGDRAYAYQWYYKSGYAAAPVGTSTTGWTLIPSGTQMPFNPGPISENRTYACFVTPLGNPACGSAGWADGVRQITVVNSWFNTGVLHSRVSNICNNTSPEAITFDSIPNLGDGGTQPGSGRSFQYRWCYRLGIHDAPTGPYTSNWIVIPGNDQPSYQPGPQTENITFACFISMGGIMQEGGWAEGCVQIHVLPPFNPGSIAPGDESLCSGEPISLIAMDELPIGSELFAYAWHYKEGIEASCPSDADTSGWVPVGPDTENSLDPGNMVSSRTYALFVKPGGLPACGTSTWAEGCRRISLKPEVQYGVLKSNDEYFSNSGDPAAIEFDILPAGAGSFTYQWYQADTLVMAGNDIPLSRWQAIQGANSPDFDPGPLSQSTSFACRVTPAENACGTENWAGGTRQITVDIATPVAKNSEAALFSIQPNPMGRTAKIRAHIPAISSPINLSLFSIDGKRVLSLNLSGNGLVEIPFHADDLKPGIYLYHFGAQEAARHIGKLVITGE